MNKNQTSKDAIEELETTDEIAILEKPEEEKLYYQLLKEAKYKKSELIKKLRQNEYSEFTTGVIIGMLLITEEVKKKNLFKQIIEKDFFKSKRK